MLPSSVRATLTAAAAVVQQGEAMMGKTFAAAVAGAVTVVAAVAVAVAERRQRRRSARGWPAGIVAISTCTVLYDDNETGR